MKLQRLVLVAINLVGGVAVLGSYWLGATTHASPGEALWGGVPSSLQPVYQASMLAAAAGYLFFTWFLVFRVDPASVRLPGGGYVTFDVLYVAILLPSALWMSLTFAWLEHPSTLRWILLRAVLFTVGFSAVAMTAAIATLKPRGRAWALGVCGSGVFAFHTLALDGIVWPILFPR
jgi:hypothetical protein